MCKCNESARNGDYLILEWLMSQEEDPIEMSADELKTKWEADVASGELKFSADDVCEMMNTMILLTELPEDFMQFLTDKM